MPDPSRQTVVARWVARTDPSGLMYGAIISAAVLATVSLHDDFAARVALTTVVVLVIYWLTDLYVHALSVRFDGDGRSLAHRLGAAALHKSSVLKGGAPAIVVFLVADMLGADASGAAFTTLFFSIGLLMVIGYLGAFRAGTTGRPALVEALGAGLLGVVIVVAKSLLH